MPQKWRLCQKEVDMGGNFHNYSLNLIVNNVPCLFPKLTDSLNGVMVNSVCHLDWSRGSLD